MKNTVLVTGGAGFIGSNFVEVALEQGARVVVYDALTYAGHVENLEEFSGNSNYHFIKGDIRDEALFLDTLKKFEVKWVANFAAESHVDRSIEGPEAFIQTNVNGTFALLRAFQNYASGLTSSEQAEMRFLHVSTDEVYGQLGKEGKFSELTPYQPNSPYSASKASSDMLVRAWHHTYKVPTLITNCSNNYGPKQFPEKLIPNVISCALNQKSIPVYGKGDNVRDWIFVKDHAHGIWNAFMRGNPGETYCLGGNSERTNLSVVESICSLLDELRPQPHGKSYKGLITFVSDRPGHDFRYAIDDAKAQRELGFQRSIENFEEGLRHTIEWYLSNSKWSDSVTMNSKTKIQYDWAKKK